MTAWLNASYRKENKPKKKSQNMDKIFNVSATSILLEGRALSLEKQRL